MMHVKSLVPRLILAASLTLPMTAAMAAGADNSMSSTAPSSKQTMGYTPQTDQQFVQSCVKAGSEGSRSFCQCLIHQLRANVPYKEFSAMDREYRTGNVSDQTRSRMARAAKACAPS